MAIALFGATGRTGSLILTQARKRGWPVRALVRSAGKLAADDLVTPVVGDARDEAAIDEVITGPFGRGKEPAPGKVGAVLCALGMQDITVPATDFSDSVKAIVAGMKRQGVRRIIVIASAGALDHPAGGYRAQHGLPEVLRHVGAEHMRNHQTLRDSGLDWTLMCPMNLVDDIPPGSAQWLYDDIPGGSVETSMADLARLMCDLLTDRGAIGKRVGIVSFRNAAGQAGTAA
jgi:putative NADH-flavin reductase